MPLYTYYCSVCGAFDVLSAVVERNEPKRCTCGEMALRGGPEGPGLVKPGGEYQMRAVMDDGCHVKGHFGKDAKRRRRS